MYTISTFLLLFFFFGSSLFSGWNETFDEESKEALHALARLQTDSYRKQYTFFTKSREKLLQDSNLKKKIAKSLPSEKFHFLKKKEGLILKKRRNNHIHDFFAWEISYLLKSSQYISPSFPIDIEGKRIIVQQWESLHAGSEESDEHSQQDIQKVSLETYWRAHLLAYLLGLADMAGRNIGISPEGMIRFFDTEISLCYFNTPTKTESSFTLGYVLQSFDWPQYRTPLDRKTAEKLKTFISSLTNVEKDIHLYLTHRQVFFPEEAFAYRLDKVRNFLFKEGVTFRDFFGSVFPRMSEGLDSLNRFTRKITGKRVDHGSALFFVCRWIKNYTLSAQEKETLRKWVERYVQ